VNSLFLDRNENQYGPAPQCFEVLAQAQLAQLSLYSRMYTQGKKSELSNRLSHDIGIPEERVLLSYGSEDMLKQVVHCYLRKGETILLPRQSWWYYKSVAAEVFGTPVEYSLHESDDRFVYDVDEMISFYDRSKPQVILIASPNNPTGNAMTLSDLTALIQHCTNAVIVLDEAYGGFSGVSDDHIKDLLEHHERLVILRTFSKYYALAGLRIGYACAGSDLKQLVSFSARYLGYNQLTEKIALAALDAPDYYHRIAQQIREDSAAYYALFSAVPGFKPFRTEANFILVRFPVAIKRELQAGLKARGVIVKFLDDPGLDDCVRVTTGTRDQNARVMGAFRDIVSSLGIPPGQPSTVSKAG
jgi:histidinol-phosphate aminotransferase